MKLHKTTEVKRKNRRRSRKRGRKTSDFSVYGTRFDSYALVLRKFIDMCIAPL